MQPMRTLLSRLRAFARSTRAAAGIELAIGGSVLVMVAGLSFDLYARVEADTVGARLVATMADYVARGPDQGERELDGDAMKKLGAFLHEYVLRGRDDDDLVFIVSALRQPAGNPAPSVEVLWSDAAGLRFGDGADKLDCTSRFVGKDADDNTVARLPSGIEAADFTMGANEVLVVAEVCVRPGRLGALSGLFIGTVYRYHVLPARAPGEFPASAPAFAWRGGAGFPAGSA